jgi:phage tail sheath protein FI
MAFQLSPGVNVTEIDLTTVVPAVATSDGAIAGMFRWGPIGERILVDSENVLLKKFAKPTSFNAETWFTAANFLSYGNRLYVSRAANTTGVTSDSVKFERNTFVNTFTIKSGSEGIGFDVGEHIIIESEYGTNAEYTVATLGPAGAIGSITLVTRGTAINATPNIVILQSDRSDLSIGSGADFNITIASNNSVYLTEGDITTLYNGMHIIQSSDSNKFEPNYDIIITNISNGLITLSNNNQSSNNALVVFAPVNTTYSAVVKEVGGIVDNLTYHIVKNEHDYETKDGNFDTDVLYIAKYPGDIGNSLKVAVCDNMDSYSSDIMLSGANAVFEIGSSTVTIKTAGNGSILASYISEGDQILAGNSAIGYQYMKVMSTEGSQANGTTVNNSIINFYGNTTWINATSGFIKAVAGVKIYNDGDNITYTKKAGNAAITGISSHGINGTNNFIVFGSNTSGFYITNTAGGSAVKGTSLSTAAGQADYTFVGNTGTLVINFEDPYRLRENYTTYNLQRHWEYFNVVGTAPGQSDYVANLGSMVDDELHVVIVDEGGMFSGTPGTILETYSGLSRATDARNNDNTVNYYKEVINKSSAYIWFANDRSTAMSDMAISLTDSTSTAPLSLRFVSGDNGASEDSGTNGAYSSVADAYNLFASAEDVDVSLILQGKPIGGSTVVNGITVTNFQLANYLIDNICESRKDCIALVSPDKSLVLNAFGTETNNLVAWRGALGSSSYAVLDSGYKYQYDRYNDVYRWIPLNGDVAGLCARTDQTNDAWWSPAGFNRGQIKNLVKLAYNPRKSERDVLYSNGVNPVVTFPGQGTVLYGDKTLLAKPSAFDRINVRRLFIVLEKAIATAAKFSLFEFNDSFTRSQFKNLVNPYLRNIQGRRGITDFLVVCDETNNTPQVIDSNQFIGDIYIKPARSINFIQLNFVAVATGVQFSEVVGKF